MKRIGITELRRQLSRNLRAVERGAEIEIADRGHTIARLLPIGAQRGTRLLPAEAPVSAVRNKRYEPARWATDSVTLLLEGRRRR
jgi:prevent-host-death family protein